MPPHQGPGGDGAWRAGADRCPRDRNYYLLLVFVKVPLLLVVVGAILWLKGPPRVPEEQWELPVHTNLSYDLAGDAAP
ncbi:hypothetical protein QTO34_008806 [Cnephaeus nilssonii]|uniref:Uncharacterized protein n=1 Tax=Cnephaeus nilssonii TaxID=3371016 RepID=A0AA40HGM3_CNENI|nr:hypothetical protein QTO34_008806 [Eptesicus nilssonii]